MAEVAETGRLRGSGTVVCVVAGGAGVGKTTFAVHAARRLARHYPHGLIHLDLHGSDSQELPVSLRTVLAPLGVPAGRLPECLDAQTALYRSLLADRQVLVLLDDARDARQVRPLLPSSPGSLVIITSRGRMEALVVRDGAHRLRLDALTTAEAHELLVRRLGAACVNADPAATRAVIEHSGGVPLALASIAASAAARRVASLTVLADELPETDRPGHALSETGSPLVVRSVHPRSYGALAHDDTRPDGTSSLAPGTGGSSTALAAPEAAAAAHVIRVPPTAGGPAPRPDRGRTSPAAVRRAGVAGRRPRRSR
jgi:hypothetical protein